MKLLLATSIIAALVLTSAPARAQTADLATAIQNSDIAAIEAAAASSTSESALGGGVLKAMRRQDEAALTDLRAAAEDQSLAAALRRDAWMTAAGIYGRQSRFPEAVAAIEAANAAAPARDEEAARDTEQTLVFTRALVTVPPMQANVAASGQTELDYDIARLPRADVIINGRTQEAVLDTGANYSTITESTARRLGLRMLPDPITVGASGNDAVAGHLAVADTLTIAGGQFRDVVFIVLPDNALSFMGGVYRIPAIVGFPVLSALGRVEFAGNTLRHSRSGRTWSADSNVLFRDLEVLVSVTANGNPVQLFMDSGAQSSNLTPLATQQFPTLLQGADTRNVRIGGAGGSRVHENAAVLPNLAINVGDRTVTIENVDVIGDASDGHHGTLGQDVLRAGSGYAIDFDALRLELLP
ncbi:retroviral-like aspartic protease family protein [Terricaulis silvestris]|uniref:Clan AA aspartic protease n=1 Tax=Terricaulis silvestris TaxID=2686094 RepID=A0A6I6MYU8_9CAUL|nr:retroviral-like aspartic protease family protein [Terricaulis silvestris]QGZ96313.1 clan AA aspartic protease [Terricaulis silvestris]